MYRRSVRGWNLRKSKGHCTLQETPDTYRGEPQDLALPTPHPLPLSDARNRLQPSVLCEVGAAKTEMDSQAEGEPDTEGEDSDSD